MTECFKFITSKFEVKQQASTAVERYTRRDGGLMDNTFCLLYEYISRDQRGMLDLSSNACVHT